MFFGPDNEFWEAYYVGPVENPKVPGFRWKKLLQDPEQLDNKTTYRDKLPVGPEFEEPEFEGLELERPEFKGPKTIVGEDNDLIIGLYFILAVKMHRVCILCAVCVVLAISVAMHVSETKDMATAFNVATFIVAVPSLFLAILAVAVVASVART